MQLILTHRATQGTEIEIKPARKSIFLRQVEEHPRPKGLLHVDRRQGRQVKGVVNKTRIFFATVMNPVDASRECNYKRLFNPFVPLRVRLRRSFANVALNYCTLWSRNKVASPNKSYGTTLFRRSYASACVQQIRLMDDCVGANRYKRGTIFKHIVWTRKGEKRIWSMPPW